jgi:phosphate transport system substrate-binding protein
VLRPKADSDSALIDNISPEVGAAVAEARKRPGLLFAVTDQECAMALEKHTGSFGPSTLALIFAEKRKLKALRINGVEPSTSNLAAGRYPYYKPLYIVTTSKTPEGAQKFIAFMQSKAGRDILSRTGHVVPPFRRAAHVAR